MHQRLKRKMVAELPERLRKNTRNLLRSRTERLRDCWVEGIRLRNAQGVGILAEAPRSEGKILSLQMPL